MSSLLAEVVSPATGRLSPDSFFFMSSYRSLVTSGCFSTIETPASDGACLNGVFQSRLREAFRTAKAGGIENPVVVGAIPFDTHQPSALFIPQSWYHFSRTQYQQDVLFGALSAQPKVLGRRAIPEKAQFMSMVEQAAQATAQPGIDKVVLSRLIDITTQENVDSAVLLERLVAQNPASFNFHVPLQDGGALLGASPELLLKKEGIHFASLPLAGSARREKENVQREREIASTLMNSAKDRHEHKLVIEAMEALLLPRSARLSIPETPELITTPTLWHLATPIEGSALSTQENALSLACLLHPTPALSGFPNEAAQRLIAELEPFERDYFGGIVGWCDAEGNGEWVVTIRCARVEKTRVRLFAGAGIVPDSSPESEWHETGVKLSTMLNVFGLN